MVVGGLTLGDLDKGSRVCNHASRCVGQSRRQTAPSVGVNTGPIASRQTFAGTVGRHVPVYLQKTA